MTEGLKELVFQEANAVKQSPRVFSNQNRPQCPHSYPLVTPVLLFSLTVALTLLTLLLLKIVLRNPPAYPHVLIATLVQSSFPNPRKTKGKPFGLPLFYMRILLTEYVRGLRSASTLYNVKRNFFTLV